MKKFKHSDFDSELETERKPKKKAERYCSQCGGTNNVRAINFGFGMVLDCCPNCTT